MSSFVLSSSSCALYFCFLNLDHYINAFYVQYHGGTNFGRTTGGPFITTSYDYDAPIDEYGMQQLPMPNSVLQ